MEKLFIYRHIMPIRLRSENVLHGFERFLLSIPSWSCESGEIIALLGPSGSGKSTFLNILGGRVVPDEGKVWYGKKRHLRVPLVPGHPRIKMVRQDFGQMPFKTVRDNLLEFAGIRSESSEDRVLKKWIKELNLNPSANDKAGGLSGGELQRLAIGQALIARPGVLLLDEPFSHLDPMHKRNLLDILKLWQHKSGSSVVMVVHDVRDALEWADRIDVIQDGSIVESGTPEEIYNKPKTISMAHAFGRVNCIETGQLDKKLLRHPNSFIIENSWFLRPENLDKKDLPKGIEFLESEFNGSIYTNIWRSKDGVSWYTRG
tara:strand:+ start:2211 stop:3161 length:951 start_codon:yes stop_codon:yes gene_type:complete